MGVSLTKRNAHCEMKRAIPLSRHFTIETRYVLNNLLESVITPLRFVEAGIACRPPIIYVNRRIKERGSLGFP